MDTYPFVSSKDLCEEFREIIGDPIYDLYDDGVMMVDFIFHDGDFGESHESKRDSNLSRQWNHVCSTCGVLRKQYVNGAELRSRYLLPEDEDLVSACVKGLKVYGSISTYTKTLGIWYQENNNIVQQVYLQKNKIEVKCFRSRRD